jgi:hypothetical protein
MTETVVLFTEYLEDDDEGHRRGDRDCCVKLRNAPDQQVTLRFNRDGARKGRLDEIVPLPVELSEERLSGPEQLDKVLFPASTSWLGSDFSTSTANKGSFLN